MLEMKERMEPIAKEADIVNRTSLDETFFPAIACAG